MSSEDERIEKIRAAVETIHRCKAGHDHSVPVRETFKGQTVWEGVVEIFTLWGKDAPAQRCYAWSYNDGKEEQYVAVLEKPPVDSEITAVRAYVASLGRN